MNISQLKVFLGDKPQHLGNENSIQNQLRDTGLKQAISGQNSQSSQRLDKFSSSTSLGVRIYTYSLNNTLEVDKRKPDFSAPDTKKTDSSLFDFEEIAKNVLKFVGGVIKNAQNKGADEDKLNDMFEQASSGVLKGIKLAEQDLAGFLNEEITNGINKSKSLIEDGIAKLKRDISNPQALDLEKPATSKVKSTGISYEKQESGELSIRTRDGDTVNITFEDLEQFEFSQRQVQQIAQQTEQDKKTAVTEPVSVPIDVDNAAVASAQIATPNNVDADDSDVSINEADKIQPTTDSIEQNVILYQDSTFSYKVKGEIDEDELKAIGQLVTDANELAKDFFNGDVETAFNQALELGFDEQELSSFALQLTKFENTAVIKAYETVSRFDGDNVDSDPAKAVKPVADYIDKLLNVLDGSRLRLEDSNSYENIINELINKLGEDVATPDLISAINRFNGFNQKLVNNLPIGYQPESKS
ncbi:DUF5610 domain-containing protein [Paraglaciecola psychrophila]|uniref:DUF5610 domain-containing protein n=1 Tax=Paraglaciecola psychrophila TaxID=326544 RepID=UPI00029168B7|nr:DUF5610 domain-containing protein [Paraglaciecola psychrophila]GAC36568.1 hypothetical protein GPSY_0930 [Paraglaciecola psychrophila 170]